MPGKSAYAAPATLQTLVSRITGISRPAARAARREQGDFVIRISSGALGRLAAVGAPQRERGLVVPARRAELTLLPEPLGQPVLGLGVRAELEQAAVRLRGVVPLAGGRMRDRDGAARGLWPPGRRERADAGADGLVATLSRRQSGQVGRDAIASHVPTHWAWNPWPQLVTNLRF